VFVALFGATVAVNCLLSLGARDAIVGLSVTPVTATAVATTVIAAVAVLLPSTVVTVIVADPTPIAVTKPDVFTVAIVVSDDDQETAMLVALLGTTVAVNCLVPLGVREALVGSTLTPVTAFGVATTVIAAVAVLPPSTVVTVIVAEPTATAVTKPDPVTVAIEESDDDQETAVFVALLGATVAVNCLVPPGTSEALAGSTVTPATET
jgi:hypothetical protein